MDPLDKDPDTLQNCPDTRSVPGLTCGIKMHKATNETCKYFCLENNKRKEKSKATLARKYKSHKCFLEKIRLCVCGLGITHD